MSELEDLRAQVQRLERENRQLEKKLQRSHANRLRLEEIKTRNDTFLQTVIDELEEAHATIERSRQQLERQNAALQHQVQERKRAEQALLEANEELRFARDKALEANRIKSAFLAKMSHELRTPLTTVLGYGELLREIIDEDLKQGFPEVEEQLGHIVDSSLHLLSLINDLLDLSKLEAGEMRILPRAFELASLLEQIETMTLPLARTRQNTFELCYPREPISLMSDRRKLHQILMNLLGNACKFTTQGTIRLEVELAPEDAVVFRVHDTGIGIPRKHQSSIFEEFKQVDSSMTTAGKGTGLGLAITRHFCHLLGGQIEVHSQLGVGSTFSISLPRQVPTRVQAMASEALVLKARPRSVPTEEPP